jgi:hypothetical protein
MKSIKILILILFFGFKLSGYSQQTETKSFQLKWQSNATFKVSKDKSIQLDLVLDNIVDENLNPSYTNSWKVEINSVLDNYSISNVMYETLSDSQLSQYNLDYIPNTLQFNFKFSVARNQKLAILKLVPMVYDGITLKRVVSFDLTYSMSSEIFKNTAASSVKNSVLATGTWYKFAVDTTGVFKIDKAFLEKLGINVSSINPKNIQIFGNGGAMLPFLNSGFRYDDLQENAIFVQGENDNRFDNNDYILFYARGPHQWLKSANNLSGLKHQNNIFSNKSYYFLTIGNSSGKRIETDATIPGNASTTITNFHDYTFFEKDEVNLLAVGQQWFGDSFNVVNNRTYTIPFNQIDNIQPLTLRVRAVAQSTLNSNMDVRVNNQNLFTINFGQIGGLTQAIAVENEGSILTTGDAVTLEIAYNSNGNPSAKAYLDYIEILGLKKLTAFNKQFSFRNLDVIENSGIYQFSISNAASVFAVWNVTNPLNIKSIQNQSSGSDFLFKVLGGAQHEFIVLDERDFYEPEIIENSNVPNQNLHSLQNIDYLIITQDFLANQAQQLANFHKTNSNLKAEVVLLNEIYNEFSSGSPDITAIRDFVKHLYSNASTNPIKYVCLFGDASYDYKNRIGGNNNIVPVYLNYDSFNLASSFVTDDYYGMMDDNEGEMSVYDLQDVVTGRIPVTTSFEAQQVINKIISYSNSEAFGDWRSQITLIADDIDVSGEQFLQVNTEKIATEIATVAPKFNLKKIYLDAYDQQSSSGGNRYPTVNQDILNQVEKGTLLVNYFGHGGEDGWASERVFGLPEIQSFTNKTKLPLFVVVTCEFTRFDNPLRKTAGEFLFLKENAGAVNLISTTRQIFISVGQIINERLMPPLLNFNNNNFTIGEALMQVKNEFATSQRYFIYNIGDPALKLKIPQPNIKIIKMNGNDISVSQDTIKALSKIKLEGLITDENGNPINNFNGELSVTVFDKPIAKKTLDNDRKNFIMDFEVIESKIFNGRSQIKNGEFEFEFIAPKDLRVAYGTGKLSLYATNFETDKLGFNNSIIVGGINENAPVDSEGPKIQLYMNDLSFIDGGTTNSSPLFLAILEDENGINTSITAVDHDIVAILDGNQNNPIILNDYFETELNDYKKGKVSYPFKNLSPGLHTLTLKVWDTYNNYSESTFSFVVVDNSDLELSNVLNYPNPFVNYTEFWFNHNKPNELLQVQVQIFTVSGKIVKTINETVQTDGNLSRSITWDGLDDFGSKIGKGVYVYKLKVQSIYNSSSAEKIEKLVILQ